MSAILIAKGKDQGFLLSDEIIAAFPNVEADIAGLDEFYSSLLDNGIEVVDQPTAPLKRPPSTQQPSSHSHTLAQPCRSCATPAPLGRRR